MLMAAAMMPTWRRLAPRPWSRFAARRARRLLPITEATSRARGQPRPGRVVSSKVPRISSPRCAR